MKRRPRDIQRRLNYVQRRLQGATPPTFKELVTLYQDYAWTRCHGAQVVCEHGKAAEVLTWREVGR